MLRFGWGLSEVCSGGIESLGCQGFQWAFPLERESEIANSTIRLIMAGLLILFDVLMLPVLGSAPTFDLVMMNGRGTLNHRVHPYANGQV
jgi:hypothetical protein